MIFNLISNAKEILFNNSDILANNVQDAVDEVNEKVNSKPNFYFGTEDPSPGLGNIGDIYIKYTE